MQNVLVVAPTPEGGPLASLGRVLAAEGYAVARAVLDGCPEDAVFLCRAFAGRPPDVLLIDVSSAPDCLPLRHVGRLLRHAWGEDAPTPLRLALLASRHLPQPDWPAFVDDFLLPPYTPGEALARITLLLFRKRHLRSADTLTFPGVTLDLTGGRAADNAGRPLPLTPREFELLRFLLHHRGKFFARDRLLDLVWGLDFEGGERTVDIHVRRLRAKLPPETADLLETRRGVGYGFRIVER
uniref:OmpR/PhoB-type domain-containing protein n=1 Tax=uncultured Armatimonadetes bacterium TaxID=157466 RepID=A0A6J4HC49_9BACT|nr:hypothetical protein AVDCRST_MAG63-405 [uncultured Armatimonadetes bacterium]